MRLDWFHQESADHSSLRIQVEPSRSSTPCWKGKAEVKQLMMHSKLFKETGSVWSVYFLRQKEIWNLSRRRWWGTESPVPRRKRCRPDIFLLMPDIHLSDCRHELRERTASVNVLKCLQDPLPPLGKRIVNSKQTVPALVENVNCSWSLRWIFFLKKFQFDKCWMNVHWG